MPTLEYAVHAMSDLLEQENAALTAMDFARAGALLGPKHAAADALAAAWRAAQGTEASDSALQRLGELAAENRRLLNRAMRVQRRVLELVARAARKDPIGARYGASGRVQARAAHGVSTRA